MDGIPLVWTSVDVNATSEAGMLIHLDLNAGWNSERADVITKLQLVKVTIPSDSLCSLTMREALLVAFVSAMLEHTSRSFLFDDVHGGYRIVTEAFSASVWTVNCPSRTMVKSMFEKISNNMLSNLNRRHFVVEALCNEGWNVMLPCSIFKVKTPYEMGSSKVRILPNFDAMIFFVLLTLCFLSLSFRSSIIYLALLFEHTDLKTFV